MPSGGDGFYYFSAFLTIAGGDRGDFDLRINGNLLCITVTDKEDSSGDAGQAACNAVTYATEGTK